MEAYISEMLAQLTLEEKISMIHGAGLFRTAPVDRLGIPALHMSDGPMGVRAEFANNEWRNLCLSDDYVTYLPCNSALASTWNRDLARATGSVLGEEARGRGKDVILAPGINIKRNPLCGRNFEYMSEDPHLISQLVVPMVEGVQSHDVAACVKHFAANSQETQRLWVDTLVDEAALNEIYFPGFKAAVEGGVRSLMGAYNLLNGEHCCTSQSLLNKTLRQDWGFDGMIVSDWGGVHDTSLAAHSAMDIEMDVIYDFDRHFMADALLEKIRSGEISEAVVDEKIRNILRLMLRLKMIGPEAENRSAGAYNTQAHQTAALRVAEESLILLKNQDSVLPLSPKVKKVAVIGSNAVIAHSNGGGSAEINALYEITPLMGIKKLLGGNVKVSYAPGYRVPEKGGRPEISWQAESTLRLTQGRADAEILSASEKDLQEALALARESDAVIFVGGLDHFFDVEGLDRRDMQLPYGQDKLIEALLAERPDTVVVLYAGSPVEMPWLSKAKAVLWSYYNGMEGGTAIAEALFGKVNPSGKLAETFLRNLEQCHAKLGEESVVYEEGIMVGYRHYDTQSTDVNFCFGHGLSYTRFRYSDLRVEGRKVSLTVGNTGSVPGKETVQLYVAPNREGRPAHTLQGFVKLELASGEEKRVQMLLEDQAFSVYDTNIHDFRVVPGVYELQVGASSRDIRLTASIKI